MSILDQIDEDLKIDPTNIQDKMYEIPNLHSKYLRHYFREKAKLNKLVSDHDLLYRSKYDFYMNRYEKIPENNKECQLLIAGDKQMNDSTLKIENQKLLVDIIDRTVKRVQYLANDIKNIVEYSKYLQGV